MSELATQFDIYQREGFALISVRGKEAPRTVPTGFVNDLGKPEFETVRFFVPKYPGYRNWMYRDFTRKQLLRNFKLDGRWGVLLKRSNLFIFDFDKPPTRRVLKLLRRLGTAACLTPCGFHVYVRFSVPALLDDINGSLRLNLRWYRKYTAFANKFRRLGFEPDPLGSSNVNDYRYVLLPPSVIKPVYTFYPNWKNARGEYHWLNEDLSQFRILTL